MSHAATGSKLETSVGGCPQGSPVAALRWLTLTDQRVASELGRAMLEVRDARLYELEGHARWLTYVRTFLGRTLRWTQYEMRRERELKSYPGLARAFQDGSLSRSKLRVILGVVTPFTEEAWLNRSRFMTVRQLEAEARLVREPVGSEVKSDESEVVPAESAVRHLVAAPAGAAALVGEALELARRVAGYQIGAGEAVSMMAAETLSGLGASPAAGSVDPAVEQGVRGASSKDADANAVSEPDPDWAEAHRLLEQALGPGCPFPWGQADLLFEATPPRDAPAHLRVVFWAGAQRRLDAVRGRLLRVVRDSLAGQGMMPRGMDWHVGGVLGLSSREADELVSLDRALSRRPFAFKMYAAGRLSRAAAWLVAKTAASAKGDHAWTRWAMTHTLRSLVAAAEAAAHRSNGPDGPLPPFEASFADLTRMCSPGRTPGPGSLRIRFSMHEEEEACYRMALSALRELYGPDRPEWWCLAVMARHFIDVHADADSRVARTLARRVIQRDNYTCAAPECLQRGGLEAHHIRYRSAGGPDSLDNLTSLCAAHHRHVQHEVGGMELRGRAPGRLEIRMGRQVYLGERLVSGARAIRRGEFRESGPA